MKGLREKTTEKWRSDAGASMILALLFFLICGMVGAVVLTAASASVGRVSQRRELTRAQNALYSAAQLISARMSGVVYTAEGTYQEDGTAVMGAGTLTDAATGTALRQGLYEIQRALAEQICTHEWTQGGLAGSWPAGETNVVFVPSAQTNGAASQSVITLSGGSTAEMDYTISAEGFPEVAAVISADYSGNIRIDLRCGADPGGKAGTAAQTLTLRISAQPLQIRYDVVTDGGGQGNKTDQKRRVTYRLEWDEVSVQQTQVP